LAQSWPPPRSGGGQSYLPAPGEEGWQNQEILDAAYRSMQSGKIEDVPRVG